MTGGITSVGAGGNVELEEPAAEQASTEGASGTALVAGERKVVVGDGTWNSLDGIVGDGTRIRREGGHDQASVGAGD